MKKLRIAQVVSFQESVPPISQSGLEFAVSWITEELVARGHDVTLFAPENSKTNAKLISLIPKHIWSIKHPHDIWGSTWRSAWNTSLVSSLAKNFDVIHVHTGTIALSMPFIQTPVVFTLHHRFTDDVWSPELADPKHLESMKYIFEQLSKINYVAISKKQETDFLAAEKFYFKNHTTIHNGIPVEQFSFNDKPKDYLLFIGYINKNKGADVAVRVAKKLNMKLILAGNNYGEEKFFDEHIRPYLSDDIQYVGPVNFEQKNELYKNARAKLAPILWDEPFGLTIVESQACGTPVIAFNKGAASEIIKHGETGFVVTTEEEMIEAVGKIDHIDRKKCREWVEENFSVSKMVDGYEKLYQGLISKNK